jgi:hypothetical protein
MGLAGQPMQLQNYINGIDFSGDQDNEKKIWDEVRGIQIG